MKKQGIAILLLTLMILSGCARESLPEEVFLDDAYRTTYEVFVYSFCDSNGDGIGDLAGVTSKLDYIGDHDNSTTSDLGCSGLWLMPIFPSPTYHKYDTTDYCAIDEDYGTMEDFETLLREAHARGIEVYLDLAINHTSSAHPWFLAATDYLKTLSADDSIDPAVCPYADYYHFSKEAQSGYVKLEGTDYYYEARFWSGMPDLNLENAAVREEIEQVIRFWDEKGVDGFRLDALTSYDTEDQSGSIEILRWFTQMAKGIDPQLYLVGEAWADQATYAKYYDSGIDSLFDFQFAGAEGVIASVVNETKPAQYYVTTMVQEEALYAQHNETYVNAPFYTNHDMARSAGYYAYDDGSKTKLAQALNLLMTGNAFLYYGEEIGMKGSGKDENKRAPMLWDSEKEAAGETAGPPGMDTVTMKFDGVSQQQKDQDSILTYVKRAIRIRNAYPAIARGDTAEVSVHGSEQVCAFTRSADGYDQVLIVINVSEETQHVSFDAGTIDAMVIGAQLNTGKENAVLKEGTLTLPGYGIVILSAAQGGSYG